jgi:hypothetical protein
MGKVLGIYTMPDGSEEIHIEVDNKVKIHNFPTPEKLQEWIFLNLDFVGRTQTNNRKT